MVLRKKINNCIFILLCPKVVKVCTQESLLQHEVSHSVDIKATLIWIIGKLRKRLRYLQGTNDYRLTYMHIIQLEVIGYPNSNFTGCVDKKVYYNI